MDNWKEAYQEASEDLRHYNSTSWQIPSATLVVISIIAGITFSTSSTIHDDWQKGILLLFGSFFTFATAWNFAKYVHRSEQRIAILKAIEQKHIAEYARRFSNDESWWLQSPLGHATTYFLMLIGLGLLILAINFLA